jgi:DNA-binding FadR family transcriptional regulator
MWYTVAGMNEVLPGGQMLERTGKTIPLYVQVAALIRQRIYSREFRNGDMLPPESRMRERYGVSQETIRSALELLRGEGLIVTGHGVGSRVTTVPSQVRVSGQSGDEISSRMPTAAERQALAMPEGVPLVVLRHPDGREEIYDSLRTRIVFSD